MSKRNLDYSRLSPTSRALIQRLLINKEHAELTLEQWQAQSLALETRLATGRTMILATTDPAALAKLRLHKAKLESELATAKFEIEFKLCATEQDKTNDATGKVSE